MKELTYVMIKPQYANNNEVINEIQSRLINFGLKIKSAKFIQYDINASQKHYIEHINKSFYPELESYLTSDKAYGMIVEGDNAIAKVRLLVKEIRNDIPKMCDFCNQMTEEERKTKNVIHASDKVESAMAEIEIYNGLQDLSKLNDSEIEL